MPSSPCCAGTRVSRARRKPNEPVDPAGSGIAPDRRSLRRGGRHPGLLPRPAPSGPASADGTPVFKHGLHRQPLRISARPGLGEALAGIQCRRDGPQALLHDGRVGSASPPPSPGPTDDPEREDRARRRRQAPGRIASLIAPFACLKVTPGDHREPPRSGIDNHLPLARPAANPYLQDVAST